jgi:serine protease
MNGAKLSGLSVTRFGGLAVAGLLLVLWLVPAAFARSDIKVSTEVRGDREAHAEFVSGEIVVWFEEVHAAADIRAAVDHVGGELARVSRVTPSRVVVSVPAGEEDAYVAKYRKLPGIRTVDKNYIYRASFTPNDEYYKYQWHFNKPDFIHAEEAWDLERGEPTVVVAVIDTGCAYEDYAVPSYEAGEVNGSTYRRAPDLVGTNFVAGYDFVHDDNHPNDQNGHGTHVSGTIAQTTNNGADVAGLAHNCAIMPIQVLDYSGGGTSDDVADGIDYARQNNADVINMSLGGTGYSSVIEAACSDANSAGLVVLAASGNRGSGTLDYPAGYDSVIAVGSVDYDGDLAYYSNWGTGQEIVAPGGDTSVDLNGDGFVDGVLQNTFNEMYFEGPPETLATVGEFADVFLQGTSMACPHAAALAALLISYGVTDNATVRTRMKETATDLGVAGYDTTYGYGLINCDGALKNEITQNEDECGECGSTGSGGALALAGLFFGSYGFIFTRRRRFFK